MADLIDFVSDATGDDSLAGKLARKMQTGPTAGELKTFFADEGYGDVSDDDCDKILSCKDNLIPNRDY